MEEMLISGIGTASKHKHKQGHGMEPVLLFYCVCYGYTATPLLAQLKQYETSHLPHSMWNMCRYRTPLVLVVPAFGGVNQADGQLPLGPAGEISNSACEGEEA